MRLFLIGVLFHEPHKEDEQDGGSGDADDDWNNHENSANSCNDHDVSIPNGNLSDYLIVNTSNEIVEVRIDASEIVRKVPFNQKQLQWKQKVVHDEDDHENIEGFLID